MSFPKLSYSFLRLGDVRLDSKAISIVESMQDNTNFPNPPGMEELRVSIENFRQALAKSKSGDRTSIAEKNKAKQPVIDQLRLLATYIEFVAQGDKVILVSSGFDLAKEPTAQLTVEPPQQFSVTNGVNAGEIVVKVKAQGRTSSYNHEYTSDPLTENSVWIQEQTTKAMHLFKGLQSGKKYWCRTAVVGSRGKKVYTNEVARIAQ